MSVRSAPLAAFAALMLATPAASQAAKADIALIAPQVRASLGKSPNSAAYVTIRNTGTRADRLVGASCACAARVELHTHVMNGGVARMAKAGSISVPARGEARLAPGGAHLMLFGLKRPIVEGAEQTITLVFERAGSVRAVFRGRARIEAAASTAGAHAH